MAESSKSPQRLAPYLDYRFRVKWDGRYVAGVSKVSGLAGTTPVIRHREGADAATTRLAPGESEYAAITLERGVSCDEAFLRWANRIFDYANSVAPTGASMSLGDFRRPLGIEIYNEAGEKVIAYDVHDAWVSEFSGGPALDRLGNAVTIERMVIQHQGWDREASDEQAGPSLDLPAR
jgi:phage tail-like protein